MAIWRGLPRGATSRAAAVVCFVFISLTRAVAAPVGSASPPSSAPPAADKATAPALTGPMGPSFSFDAQDLTGENRLPFSSGGEDDLAPWKAFNTSPLPTDEGSVIYLDPAAAMRAAAPPPPITPPWQAWVLPGGLALGAALIIAGGLAFWRITIARRAAADLAAHYEPPGQR